jgi:hypothetical protein
MPNRFGRGVGAIEPFNPRGLLPDLMSPIARPDGSGAAQLSAASGSLASTIGGIADQAARAEGEQAGKTAGLDPHYRPDGSLTIRGQAFNEAATKTYVNNLDAKLRTDLQSTFEANKNNPAALKKAYDDLHAKYTGPDGDVFPEIKGDFNAQFARLRMPYENKALGNFEEDTHAANRAALIDNTTATQTNAARMAAADPANPATARNIQVELDRHAKLIDDQVANGDITADAGARLKIKTRDDVLSGAALAQAGALKTPEEIAAYRANVKAKFAKGEFNGLSGDGYQSLDAGLQHLESQKRTALNAGAAQLSKNLDDYIERAANGYVMSPAEWTAFQASDAAKTPKGAAILQSGEAKLKIAGLLGRMSIDDASRMVSTMRAQANSSGGASSADADVIGFAEQQLRKQRTALDTDQLGYAEQRRLVPAVAPIDFQGFSQAPDPTLAAGPLAAQFRDRTAQARAIGSELSRAPQFLRPDEKDRLKEIVDRGGAPALALAGAIVKGADSDAPAILREISADAPLLAQAGNIIANGGSLSAARDAFNAARVKAETGKELPGIASSAGAKVMRDTLGSALMLQGEDAGRIRATADAVARTRIASASVDPKSREAETIYSRALQEAAGASFVGGVQYGGFADYKPGYWTSYKVIVPPGIKADSFRDVVRSIKDDDLAALPVPPKTADGKAYSARDLASAIPVAVRGGYRFAMAAPGSDDPKYIRGADGAPFVLPFSTLQTIAPRVSGALRGQ